MRRTYHMIGACSGWGAQIRACERGPEGLALAFPKMEMVYPEKLARNETIDLAHLFSLIQTFNLRLMQAVRKAVQNGSFPIVVGGDHSIAVGTWNAFDVPFGLIWIDAHLDSHTVETSPSGAYHGMPVAALLGYGMPEMAQMVRREPVLKPQNLVFIGVRSFEPEEIALLEKCNVKIYFMEEVRKRGLAAIIPEAIAHVTRGVARYGVSLDLDVFSLQDAPGVGSPEEGGISAQEMLPLLAQFGNDPRLLAFELVEFNPERDVDHKTRELAVSILREVMK